MTRDSIEFAVSLPTEVPGHQSAAFADRKMRLLRTSTFKLESFFEDKIPPYAILSRTWGDKEITLQELEQKDATILLNSTKI